MFKTAQLLCSIKTKTQLSYVLRSQLAPVKPAAQVHVYPVTKSVQVAAFEQGVDRQASTSASTAVTLAHMRTTCSCTAIWHFYIA